MKYIYIIIIVFAFSSCENTNYGNGYKFDYGTDNMQHCISLDKGNIITAADSKDVFKKKGTLIKFHNHVGMIDSVYVGREAPVIEAFVDQHNISFNSNFIIVDQKPLDSIFGGIIEEDNTLHWKINPSKEALMQSPFHKYWVIDKRTDDIYGPLSKKEYYNERRTLNIPESLTIKVL